MKLIRKNKDGEKGQSLVEFTLIIPIFLLLVFAIVDFGMGFHAWISVTNAAREGARIGAVGADDTTIEARVRDTVGGLDDEDLSVNITNAQGDPGEAVSVTVEYDYELITPLSGLLGIVSGGSLGPTLDFNATSEMRLE